MKSSLRPGALLFAALLTLAPFSALATTATLTWDGSYIESPDGQPEAFLSQTTGSTTPGKAPYPSYAKLHYEVKTVCDKNEFRGSKINGWDEQSSRLWIKTNWQCTQKEGMSCNSVYGEHDTADTAIAFDAFVYPGVVYMLSGYAECFHSDSLVVGGHDHHCGGHQADGYPNCHGFYSDKVGIPPRLYAVTLQSTKNNYNFNKFKVGETLKLTSIEHNIPDKIDNSSNVFPIQKILKITGPGIDEELDLNELEFSVNMAELTPNAAGTVKFQLITKGYVYYYDHWHGGQMDKWNTYDWNKAYPENNYTQEKLYSKTSCSDEDCVEKCAGDETCLAKYHAELWTLESEVLEIPVTDSWCVTQKRQDVPYVQFRKTADPDEECRACSATFTNASSMDVMLGNADDPCANGSSEEEEHNDNDAGTNPPGNDAGNSGGGTAPADKDNGSSGCSAAGTGALLSAVVLMGIPAIVRRKKK